MKNKWNKGNSPTANQQPPLKNDYRKSCQNEWVQAKTKQVRPAGGQTTSWGGEWQKISNQLQLTVLYMPAKGDKNEHYQVDSKPPVIA